MQWFKPNKMWYAVAVLVASTIGVGFYGIPFTFAKAGLTSGLLFFLGVVFSNWLVNLLMGEIVLRTHQRHQFVGYVNKYLGPIAKNINIFIFWVSIYGALIGIIIISGDFLSNLLSAYFSLSQVAFSTIFLVAALILVLAGLKTVSKFDLVIMAIVIGVIFIVGFAGIIHVDFQNYTFEMTSFWFLPFGVILFSLNSTGVPLMREVMVGSERELKKAITFGTLIPSAVYLFFAVIVLGICGEVTSPDSISSLRGFLGPKIVFIGSLMGFITSSTIFINITTSLKESLQEDFHIRRKWMWIFAMLPPYLLFLSGIRNFIDIISLVGGVAVSLHLILLIMVYVKAKLNGDRVPEYSIRLPVWAMYALITVFMAAAIYTVIVK